MYINYYKEVETEEEELKLIKELVWPVNLTYVELHYEVEYNIFGKNLPATRTDPEEYAELEIIEVTLVSVNGFKVKGKQQDIDILSEKDKDRIEALCWEDVESIYNDISDYYD